MGPSDSILKAPNSVSSINAHIPSAKDKILEPRPAALSDSRGAEFSEGGQNSKGRNGVKTGFSPGNGPKKLAHISRR